MPYQNTGLLIWTALSMQNEDMTYKQSLRLTDQQIPVNAITEKQRAVSAARAQSV